MSQRGITCGTTRGATSRTTRLVLVGAGHTHALLLDAWARQPELNNLDVELVMVTPVTDAPYSGMIPGWLAGQYRFEETTVNFRKLCSRSSARLIQAELVALDPDARQIQLSDGQTISYDWLSLNVGSTLRAPDSIVPMLAMRPLSTLKARYEQLLERWQQSSATTPLRITAVGGGAAGIESLLCVQQRLRQLRPDRTVQAQLVTRGTQLLPGFGSWARRLTLQVLHEADVTVQLGTEWCETIARSSDLVIWATGAQPQDWQTDPARRGSLQTDAAGFIEVDNTLRSRSHHNIFAAGDCAALPSPVPKAGVYAVRMGSTLTANVRRAMAGLPGEPFQRQGVALALLNTADGQAIASWDRLGWRAHWVMRWKDHIDRRFIARFNQA